MDTTTPTGPWFPQAPAQFQDKRSMLRQGRHVQYRVVAYAGIIARKGDTGQMFDRCPHAHAKPGAARKCAQAAARRVNKALARGEEWATAVGT